jgi:hypothetical protein
MKRANQMSGSSQHANLNWYRAVWNALWGSLCSKQNIEFYPLLSEDGEPKSQNSEAILAAIADEMAKWPSSIRCELLDKALERARESLDEVKELMEYQDQKATRLLTIATLLSAFSGALFLRFTDAYPITSINLALDSKQFLLVVAYFLFWMFAVSSAAGALVTFHATRARFKYPSFDHINPENQENDPKSQIFYIPIIKITPGAWARSYVGPDEEGNYTPRTDIQYRYLKNYVSEAYLIAAKAADKLRYLEPAQRILSFALACLLIWLLLFGVISLLIGPTKTSEPIPVRIEAPAVPIMVRPNLPRPAPDTALPQVSPKPESQLPPLQQTQAPTKKPSGTTQTDQQSQSQ